MKYIITENQLKLLRRIPEIESHIDDFLLLISSKSYYPIISLDNLILTVADNVAVNIADESNLTGDDYITLRNQIKQFIRSNYYEDIKNFRDKKI